MTEKHVKKLPTAAEIAANIANVISNTEGPIIITNNEIKEISERQKFRAGLREPIIDELQSNGLVVTKKRDGIIVSDPFDNPIPTTFSLAKKNYEKDQEE